MDIKIRLITALALCQILNFSSIAKQLDTVAEAYGSEAGGRTSDTSRIELGHLTTGAAVSFSQSNSGEWGIEIDGSDAPRLFQPQPARLEVFRKIDDIRQLAAGYNSVEKVGGFLNALAEIPYDSTVTFRIEDQWSINGANLDVKRKVEVKGNAPGGFYSALAFCIEPDISWTNIELFVPGVLYGKQAENSDNPIRGFQNEHVKNYSMREDGLSSPMLALSFRNGASVTMLDPSPRGDTTAEETDRNKQASVMIDERYAFGALGAYTDPNGGITFGFWLPGTIGGTGQELPGLRGPSRSRMERRRYNCIQDGFTQTYSLTFRFGQNESFPELIRNTWRWAWQRLNPPVTYLDIETVRRSLTDQLASNVGTVEDRTGITWIFDTVTGRRWSRPDDMRVIMGFVGKNLEAADQLLREADRDQGPRGQSMRILGLEIIESFIRLVKVSPPSGEGFDLLTGEPMVAFPPSPWRSSAPERVFIRSFSEDMYMLMKAYSREQKQGREHPEWIRWCRDFADWLLPQQREDGSFPRSWKPGTGEVVETSGSSSYNPVPLLVLLSRETGQSKYLEAATRTAEYVWMNYGKRCVFVGGTLDNPDVVDKEAGMLSLEAFLALYEQTHDSKWLDRAKMAADYTETWIWIWNVPIPEDAGNGALHWKKGVPTYGLQGITAGAGGGVDEYMDWSTPAYAKLYKYTNDSH
jgi:hypothetical protein